MQHRNGYQLIRLVARVTALVLIFSSIPDAHSQSGSRNTLPKVAEMFLGKWQGEGKTEESNFTSELSFAWTLDKNFLEVENYVDADGKREKFAVTLYGWQPVLGKLVFWSFDRDGTINEGVAEIKQNELRHQWRAFSKEGEIRERQSSLSLQDADHLIFRLDDSRGMEVFSISYKRVRK